MKSPDNQQRAGATPLPLPGRQFQRFILVFHVVFLFGMGFVLLNRLQRFGWAIGWPEIGITLLVLAQAGMYLRFFAVPGRWPVSLDWWCFYFPVCLSLWFITWRLEPAFEWIVLGYLGQMFGVLPPRFSITAGAALFALYLAAKVGWSGLARLSPRDWLGYLSIAVGWTALGLFLHKLVITSAERASLIQELEAAHKELELARQRDSELAALRERERLARELHDSIGHGLVTLTVQLEAAQRLCRTDPVRASALFDDMKQLTRTTMEQLRRSLAGLRSPGLGARPLEEALQEFCRDVAARAALRVDCHVEQHAKDLPPSVSEVLWRVAQEGLVNVEKHARASAVRISLHLEGRASADSESSGNHSREVILRVADDGIGLPADAESRPGHYGLRGLRERVEGLGGGMRLSTATPKGTILEARLPLLT